VAADGIVYVGSNDGNVYALDAKSGMTKWSVAAGGRISGSAAVVGGVVYMSVQKIGLLALNTADGAELWRYGTNTFCGGSPVVVRGAVVFGTGNKRAADTSPSQTGPIVALNAADGQLLWEGHAGPFTSASLATDGQVLFSHYHSQYTVCSVKDGELLHNVFQTGGQRYPWGSASYASGRFYYPLALAGYVDCYEFDASGKPKRVWRNATHEPNLQATVQLGATGGYEILGDLAVTDTLVLAPCWDGNLYAFSTEDGKLMWKFQTGGPVMGSPSVAGDTVYFGSWDHHLYAVGLDGKLRSKIKLGGRVNSSPWPAGGAVFVGCDDGNVYAVGE
jgi:outer membrane protein assembly factor BamB